ncbi:beta-glucosidase BglX [Acidicapsa dinghuensis]|uniref:beta-glucosidase n=1 Tax=Acidicapsa dinghuensis TaxID=2218256 RepID=A0ABW1EDM5_9BACT|nr:beta-glucosidase BglX [Acidicapsa dinghuensis]
MRKTFEQHLLMYRFIPLISVISIAMTMSCTLSSVAQIAPTGEREVVAPAGPAESSNAQLADKALNAKVEALLKQMTLEEKIGQTVQYSAGFATGPAASKLSYAELTERGAIGSMLNVIGAEETNRYQHIAMEKSRLHIPLLFGHDVIHGEHTIFPVPLGLAASWDPRLIEGVAHTSAIEARADGLAWVFSPMVDISRDARWGRIVESAGEDPYLGSTIARGWVKGYQQGDLSKPDSVAASVKHFAAYGAAIAGRDYNAVDMSDITLRQVYLPPYHAAVEAGVATVMTSFNSINGMPATADHYTLTDILRKEWDFDGFVVSDWGAVAELLNHAIGPDGTTVARKAIEAGTDMDMEGNLYATTLAAQIRSGEIPESVLDEAVRRILRVKFALGLFDHPYTPVTSPYQPSAANREQARSVADETIVLLKNDAIEGHGALLPLAKSAKTVALIGPLADSPKDMLGSWSALGDPKFAVSLRQALQERLGDKLLYAKGCGVLSGKDELVLEHASFTGGTQETAANEAIPDDSKTIAEAVETAKKADVAILALGESADWMTGEASSRAHLGLPGHQEQLLEAVAATGKPVILVLFTGRPSVIPWAAAHVPAIVEAWFPGIEGGHAVADVLFGDVNPSGKLPAGFPRAEGQEPLYYAQMPTGRPAARVDLSHMPTDPAEKFVSRYIDEENSAQFPFGWGLSYTRFSYSKPTVNKSEVALDDLAPRREPAITVGVDVKNTGSVAGSEVVQLYIRQMYGSVEQPLRELKGFERVTLAPGEEKHVTFPLGFNELSFYNVKSQQVVEPTTYKVFVGGSSLATQETSFDVR